MKFNKHSILIVLIISFFCYFTDNLALADKVGVKDKDNSPIIKSLTLNSIALRDFARILTKVWHRPIAVSKNANKYIDVFLENVSCENALKIVCRSNALWYRQSDIQNVIFIETVEEYKKNAKVYNEQFIESVTLLYPSIEDIGETLKDLFRDRIVWTIPNQDLNDASFRMDKALNRMDILAERGQFSLTNSDSEDYNSSNSSDYSSSSSNNSEELTYNQNRLDDDQLDQNRHYSSLPPELADPQQFKPGVVYVAGMSASNTLLLRSSDKKALKQVLDVIKKLDKPAPQVLLEVKILELRLTDQTKRGFDILFKSGDFSGGYSNGLVDINGDSGGNAILNPNSILVPQGSGLNQRAAVFNYISKNVRARIQAMQENGNLNLLSTPSLLVADNEASRIFIGTETTILTELNVNSNTTSGNNPVTTYSYDPITQRRNIGTTLLITPKIHADRSVTIRLMQETSDRGSTQKVIYGTNMIGGQQYFDTTDINQRIVTTTVEAIDSQIIAIGGLVRESEEVKEEGAPIAKDIPLIGSLFKRVSKRKIRTELIILIRPFVLLAPGETEKASDEFLKRISRHKTSGENHPELNLHIEKIKSNEKKSSKTGIKWLDNWLYPKKEKNKEDNPNDAVIQENESSE